MGMLIIAGRRVNQQVFPEYKAGYFTLPYIFASM